MNSAPFAEWLSVGDVLPWHDEFEDLYANVLGFGRTLRDVVLFVGSQVELNFAEELYQPVGDFDLAAEEQRDPARPGRKHFDIVLCSRDSSARVTISTTADGENGLLK